MKEVILLYYKFIDIAKTYSLMREQRSLCNRLHLKGRIIIAKEGINGTVSGTKEATDEYMKVMHKKAQHQGSLRDSFFVCSRNSECTRNRSLCRTG